MPGTSDWARRRLEGLSLTVETAIGEMGRWLIGQDPRRIEHIWQHLYRGAFYRGGPVLCSALSGIDQALWDILGKHLGVPVYQLLGGAVRESDPAVWMGECGQDGGLHRECGEGGGEAWVHGVQVRDHRCDAAAGVTAGDRCCGGPVRGAA
jgi:L-alanine-DL-glutamate epimerase-like enolase superfamily enzyme